MYFFAMDDVLDGLIGPDDLVRDSLGERYSPEQIERRLVSTEVRIRGSLVDELVDDFYSSESTSASKLEELLTPVFANNKESIAFERVLQRHCPILALQDNNPHQPVVEKVYYGKDRREDLLHLVMTFVSAASFHRYDEYVLRELLYPKTATELFPESAADPSFDPDNLTEQKPEPRELRRGGPDPLLLARTLLQKGASPNARLGYLEIPNWRGSYWTPWTVTLLSLAGVIRKSELLDDVLLDLVELYLSHGADPTICFVGRYIPKHKLRPVPVWRVCSGTYATLTLESHIPKLFDEEHAGWHYLTLAQLVEPVAPHPKKKAVVGLLYSKSPWAVSRWVAGPPQAWELELAQLGTCYFFVPMVVQEHELKSLVISDSAKSRLLPTGLIPI
ncbi:hypothetical protein MFIFM68171_02663 [Madurella fahalii]|uniref:Uncharacterized protein n=1 Tax=Madurella fahalii TaxID=1157608 RepID=A0ABQ0G3W3_9PEZI